MAWKWQEGFCLLSTVGDKHLHVRYGCPQGKAKFLSQQEEVGNMGDFTDIGI